MRTSETLWTVEPNAAVQAMLSPEIGATWEPTVAVSIHGS